MPLKRNTLIFILALLIAAFTYLSFFIAQHPIFDFDIKTSLFIQQYHTDLLDKLMLAISFFGGTPLFITFGSDSGHHILSAKI